MWMRWPSDDVMCTRVYVCVRFQSSLQRLMETLNQANPFFVRCIKSNAEKVVFFAVNLMILSSDDVIMSWSSQMMLRGWALEWYYWGDFISWPDLTKATKRWFHIALFFDLYICLWQVVGVKCVFVFWCCVFHFVTQLWSLVLNPGKTRLRNDQLSGM